MPARAPHGTNQPPKIVVKKIYIEGHGGHHGGAWKVAYADFVTAMMAFFLLLWLLGATTEKQRKGIADYFAPTILDTKSKGVTGGGLFGGDSVLAKDPLPTVSSAPALASSPLVAPTALQGGPESAAGTPSKLRETVVAEDRKNFEQIRRRVAQKILSTAELRKLASHVRFVPTRDGLRIDLVDDANYSMFALGTTALTQEAGDLIALIARTVAPLPNTLMIRGHTDSLPYGDPRAMNNWMLSSGRAEATRRRLALGSVPEGRFERIEGVADREPMIVKDPADPRNRRVAITLLYRRGPFGR